MSLNRSFAAIALLVACFALPTGAAGGARPSPSLPDATLAPQVERVAAPPGSLDPGPRNLPAPRPNLQPSIHYEDALAHRKDKFAFHPGAIVKRGFRPRAADRWKVGGGPARSLPAGRKAGRDLLKAPERSTPQQTAGPSSTPRPTAAPAGTAFPEQIPAPAESMTPEVVPVPAESVPDLRPSASPVVSPEAEPALEAASPAAAAPAEVVLGRLAPVSGRGTGAVSPAAPVATGGLNREVFGFLPYWELGDSSTRLDYSVLSTIAYFGVGATADGRLAKFESTGAPTTGWAGWASSDMTTVINDAHRNGTRVVLTVERFSWSSSGTQETVALLSSPTARQSLASEIATAVRDRGADGVNLDFEPIPSGQSTNFVSLVREVRAALDAHALGYQLTFDATGYVGNYDIAALTAPGAADAVFIMGYDYRGSSASTAGSIAPMGGPLYDITETVNAYLARTSPSQIILGVPYYGRAWSTTTDAAYAPTQPQGSTFGYSSTVLYHSAVDTAGSHGKRYSSLEQVAWTAYQRQNCSSCPVTWRQLYYDDDRALSVKYDLVHARSLRGTGMWALGYDEARTELSSLLRTKFTGPLPGTTDTTPPKAGIRLLPQRSIDEGIRVAWVAVDEMTGVSIYDVQVSIDGGSWTTWLDDTAGGEGTYLGLNGHGYAFRVRARDGAGNWGAYSVTDTWRQTPSLAVGGFGRVTAASLTLRSGPGTSYASLGTLASGDRVAILSTPVSDGAYSWYRVRAPLHEWKPVTAGTFEDAYLAGGTSTSTYVVAAHGPHATTVRAGIWGFSAGAVGTATLTDGTLTEPVSDGPRLFSPNGDGRLDALRVSYTLAQPVDQLALRVYRATDRTLVGSISLPGLGGGAHAWDWNGSLDGARLADGQFLLQLVGTVGTISYAAPAANMADPTLSLAGQAVTIDTVAPEMAAPTASLHQFSPNGDGSKDTTTIAATAPGAVSWTIELVGSTDVVRRSDPTGGSLSFSWDGRDEAGAVVPDGSYVARLRAFDAAGNVAVGTRPLTVDTTPPTGTLSARISGLLTGTTTGLFSPNGDGLADSVNLRWSTQERAGGTLNVRDATGRTVWYGKMPLGISGGSAWDGRSSAGAAVPDGRYAVVARILDPAGNRADLVGTIHVDRALRGYGVEPRLWYPQDRDLLRGSTDFQFSLAAPANATLEITRSGEVVKRAWSGRALAAGAHSWRWDGRDDGGRFAARGSYVGRLTVVREGRRQVLGVSTRLMAFDIGFDNRSPGAGSSVRVFATSAEPLGGAPTIGLSGAGDDIEVSATRAEDGRWTALLPLSTPGQVTITVTGTDSAGGLNRSYARLTVR